MNSAFVRQNADGTCVLGNETFKLGAGLTTEQIPVVQSLILAAQPDVDRASATHPLAPALVIQDVDYTPAAGNMRFERCKVDEEAVELRLHYTLSKRAGIR